MKQFLNLAPILEFIKDTKASRFLIFQKCLKISKQVSF